MSVQRSVGVDEPLPRQEGSSRGSQQGEETEKKQTLFHKTQVCVAVSSQRVEAGVWRGMDVTQHVVER